MGSLSLLKATPGLRTARDLVREQSRAPDEGHFQTWCSAFDRLLSGGLPRGTMVELIGRGSTGRFSLVLTALSAATGSGESAALVDLGDGFDPRAGVAAGIDLERLLWVRPRRLKEVLASTEVILQCGMPLVVIDLGLPPVPGGRGAEASWLRLGRLAQAHRAALLVASPYRATGTSANKVLELQEPEAWWSGRGSSVRVLDKISSQIELVKSRGWTGPREGDRELLSLRTALGIRQDPQDAPVDAERLRSVPVSERETLRPRAVA